MPRLDDASLAARNAGLDHRIAAWKRAASARIDRAVADAHAHAVKAVTEAMKASADGRATLAKARRNPSALAAAARLDELWAALAGPSMDSLAGLVRDAWEAAFVAGMQNWGALLPDDLLRGPADGLAPTKAELVAVRRIAIVDATELRREVGAPIERAKHGLVSSLGSAGRSTTPDRDRPDLLRAWAARTAAAIAGAAHAAIDYGMRRADAAAGWHAAHPDVRGDGPGPLGIGG